MKARGPIAGVVTLMAALLLVAGSASAAPRIFDGSRDVAKPSTLRGWSIDGGPAASSRLLIGGLNGRPNGGKGSIEWRSWRPKMAIGLGTGWAPRCKAPCRMATPWNGTTLRVTAFRQRQGKFTRLRVFQWTGWMRPPGWKRENYTMKLAYTGLRPSGLSWKVIALDDGLK